MKRFAPLLAIITVLALCLAFALPVAAMAPAPTLVQGPAVNAAPAVPAVVSIVPATKAIGVSCTPKIIATFSDVVNATNLPETSFGVFLGLNKIDAKITYDGKTATLVPSSSLRNAAIYEVRVGTANAWFETYRR